MKSFLSIFFYAGLVLVVGFVWRVMQNPTTPRGIVDADPVVLKYQAQRVQEILNRDEELQMTGLDQETQAKLNELKKLALKQLENGHDYDGHLTGFFNEYLIAVDSKGGAAVDALVEYFEREILERAIKRDLHISVTNIRTNFVSGYFDAGEDKKALEQERLTNLHIKDFEGRMEMDTVYHSYRSLFRVFRGYTQVWQGDRRESGISRQGYYLTKAKEVKLKSGQKALAFSNLAIMLSLYMVNGRVNAVMEHYPELAKLSEELGTENSAKSTAAIKKFIDTYQMEKAQEAEGSL